MCAAFKRDPKRAKVAFDASPLLQQLVCTMSPSLPLAVSYHGSCSVVITDRMPWFDALNNRLGVWMYDYLVGSERVAHIFDKYRGGWVGHNAGQVCALASPHLRRFFV